MRLDAERTEALAAEFVLGTLRGRARRRFASMALADPKVGAAIRRWEDSLTPLAERIAPVQPPERVWSAIASRLEPRRAESAHEAGRGFWSSLAFWRGFGLLAGGLASALLAAFLWMAPHRAETEPRFVSVLVGADAVPRMVISLHERAELRVKTVKPWGGMEDKSLQLWALGKDGVPRSLGLVANEGESRIRLPAADGPVATATTLAISLEPRGGSPTGLPSGPVLCSGAIVRT